MSFKIRLFLFLSFATSALALTSEEPSASSSENVIPPYKETIVLGRCNKRKIEVKTGQELIFSINNSSNHWHNSVMPHYDGYSSNDVCYNITYDNYGGWDNWFYRNDPLEENIQLNTSDNEITFHFIARHPGTETLDFFVNSLLHPHFETNVITITVK